MDFLLGDGSKRRSLVGGPLIDRQVCPVFEDGRQTGILLSRGGQNTKTKGKRRGSPRERLLDTAGALFLRYGFQAVGIDRILAESQVAKMTLYRHFPSKEALIEAYIERADEQFWTWANEALARGATARQQMESLFAAVARLATDPRCLGCVFQAAAIAFPDLDHPGHGRAIEHKLAMRDRLTALAQSAGFREPKRLAAQLALLMDGAWVAARMFGPGNPAAGVVKEAAEAIMKAHERR